MAVYLRYPKSHLRNLLLKISQYITLTDQRKCHPSRDNRSGSKNISIMLKQGQFWGTLRSSCSEIVRYTRNTAVVSSIGFWILLFFAI
jgi:hypothetical protein